MAKETFSGSIDLSSWFLEGGEAESAEDEEGGEEGEEDEAGEEAVGGEEERIDKAAFWCFGEYIYIYMVHFFSSFRSSLCYAGSL